MKGFLLDTNVLSELRRPRPDPRVVDFVSAQPEALLYVSAVTLAEIRFGIDASADAARRQALTDWLMRTVRPIFADRIVALTEDVLVRWRHLLEAGRRRGHTFGALDGLIAACAAHAGLVVVSRDTTDHVAAGVPLLQPWSATFIDANGRDRTVANPARPDLLVDLTAGR